MKTRGWRVWHWLLLTGFTVSLGLNYFLTGIVRQNYRQQLAASIWPGDTAVPAITGTTTNFTRTILLCGDSRMAEWSLPAPPGTRLVNAGIRRATTSQLLPLLPGWLVDYRPALVIIQAGMNDLKYIGLEPQRADEVMALTYNNLTNLAGLCLARGCQVMLLPVWPPARPDWRRWPFWNNAIPESVNRLNQRLLSLTNQYPELPVPDLFSRAGLSPGQTNYRDTLHLRPDAYARMTSILTNIPPWPALRPP